MKEQASGGRDYEGAKLTDSVFKRWASESAKRGRSCQEEQSPIYVILTCPTTCSRTLFYVPAPAPPSPRRAK